MISKTFKTALGFCRPNLGFESNYVSARYICATGAMTLLYLGVGSNIIKLIGRWRSDYIIRYIQVQAEPLMRNFSRLMIMHVNYYFL